MARSTTVTVSIDGLPAVRAMLTASGQLLGAVEANRDDMPEDVADAAATLRALIEEWRTC